MELTKDVARIEALFNDFFIDVFSREHLREGFANLGKVIGVYCTDPDFGFIIVCHSNDTRIVMNGDGEYKPDITITMDWEVAHKFWMDDLDILSAVLTSKIKLAGDIVDLYNLRPLFKETSAIYQKLASEHFLNYENPNGN